MAQNLENTVRDLQKRVKALEGRLTHDVGDLNRINQRVHDEIVKLDKRVKAVEKSSR